jgi:type II secretory pathway pseudopilin PulG
MCARRASGTGGPSPSRGRGRESGFALIVLVAGIAVMMILMGAATPTWRYLMQDDRELELFFRGDQVARGVEAYQRKNGGAFPPSLDVLVQGRYLRRSYKDPMTRDGQWRLVRPGEMVGVGGRGVGAPGTGPRSPTGGPSPRASATPSPFTLGAGSGTSVGAIAGVASRSRDTSLRVFNGRTKYDEWVFLAGQPRRLGRDTRPGAPGIPGSGPSGLSGLSGLSGGGLGGSSPRPSPTPAR